MNSTIEKPEYEIANDEAKALFESLGLTCAISAPLPDVKDEWPNILYNVTFSKGAANLTTEYRLGVGHVNWPKRFEDIPRGGDVLVFNTLRQNPGAQLRNKSDHAAAAALLARVQKVAPKPYEVLAAICDDSQSAHGESWDNYASNFGMDAASIKGRKTYDFCCDLYHKVAALIGADNVRKFAELHCQF